VTEAIASMRLGTGEAALWWLGQSTFLLRFETATVFVDPYLAPHADRLVPPAFAPEDARGIDVVAVTHDHLDHLGEESLPGIAAASPAATFVAPRPAVERILGLGIASERVVGLQDGESVELPGVRIHAVAASHADDAAEGYGFHGGAFLGFVFEAGVRVYHAGDTIPYDGLAERVRAPCPHVALLPINGRDAERESQGIAGNLDEREAAELAAAPASSSSSRCTTTCSPRIRARPRSSSRSSDETKRASRCSSRAASARSSSGAHSERYAFGWMFWLTRKRLSGSYVALIFASRS
jgi:L-ascorbate 6-phosphate lactonase